jgi:hypothetical protein
MLFAPGESWAYSNIGYMFVVESLERVSGQTLAQVLTQLVIQPLALRRTLVLETTDDLTVRVPGLGSEVTEDGSLVDVRGRYHPGWCAPRGKVSIGMFRCAPSPIPLQREPRAGRSCHCCPGSILPADKNPSSGVWVIRQTEVSIPTGSKGFHFGETSRTRDVITLVFFQNLGKCRWFPDGLATAIQASF